MTWQDSSTEFAKKIAQDISAVRRTTYRADRKVMESEVKQIEITHQGDYRTRQIVELIQNGADAIGLASEAFPSRRIQIILTRSGLYCANGGAPFDFSGIQAISYPMISNKKGDQIGRFGMGFVSVLAVTDEPRIYSRTVSCHYSFESASAYLSSALTTEESVGFVKEIDLGELGTRENPRFSIFSIPKPVNPSEFFAQDEILEELSSWASTIVHLPFTRPKLDSDEVFNLLSQNLKEFPAEFSIFAKNVDSLEFQTREEHNVSRKISCESTEFPQDQVRNHLVASGIDPAVNGEFEVRKVKVDSGGGAVRDWLVATLQGVEVPNSLISRGVQLTLNRRRNEESGELLPLVLHWAVPLTGQKRRGEFWFFLPTQETATTKGIMNAPWDLNNERTRLLDNSYNSFLNDQFGELILRTVPFIIAENPDDVGVYLDYFPGRGYEDAAIYAARSLGESVRKAAAKYKSLLDLDGRLQRPETLKRPPENISSELLKEWADIGGLDRRYPHWTLVSDTDRNAKVVSYLESAGVETASDLTEWIEQLVASKTVEYSKHAIKLVAKVAAINPIMMEKALQAKVLICADGSMTRPQAGSVFFTSQIAPPPGMPVVHPELMADEAIRNFLIDECQITEANDAAELDRVLLSWTAEPSEEDWRLFWRVSERYPFDEVSGAINRHSRVKPIKVFTLSGSLMPLSGVFLPGKIFLSGEDDDGLIIDTQLHSANLDVLRGLGADEVPKVAESCTEFPFGSEYMEYLKKSASGKLTDKKVEQLFGSAPLGPKMLDLWPKIGRKSKARFTTWILENVKSKHFWKPNGFEVEVEVPAFWFAKRNGLVESSMGPSHFEETLSGSMTKFARIIAVSDIAAELTDDCGLRTTLQELPKHTLENAIKLLESEFEEELIGEFLATVCRDLTTPNRIPSKKNGAIHLEAPGDITVLLDRELFQTLSSNGVPVLLVPTLEHEEALVASWGLKPGETFRREFETVSPEEPELVSDKFWLLNLMKPIDIEGVTITKCSSLVSVIQTEKGQIRENIEFGISRDKEIYLISGTYNSEESTLHKVNELLKLNLSNDDIRKIIENAIKQNVDSLKREIRSESDEVKKVQKLFTVEQMWPALPPALLDEISAERDNSDVLASMLLAVHGPQLLEKTKSTLAAIGLQPPTQWAGSRAAIGFVAELGFDRAYAGFREEDRAPHVDVSGRLELLPLHDYQKQLKDEVKEFIEFGKADQKWRTLLYLPTGAGKTRVTVQAVLELVNEGKLQSGPIIWIAQGYELCEQAVQAFSEVWSAIGTSGVLSVDRFWENKEVEKAELEDFAGQIVVATDAKVDSAAVGSDEYKWLQKASLVIVDEAHKATTPMYTRILDWLETGTRLKKNSQGDKRPVLGLSATPAKRGVESRFGPKILRISRDILGDVTDVDYLRKIGVLAYADHRLLKGVVVEGGDQKLVVEEVEDNSDSEDLETEGNGAGKANKRTVWLPTAIEDELAQNRDRNKIIIEDILSLDPSWSVIVFALSVGHAQFLAAVLAKNGIKSASVSSATSRSIRKLHINNFRNGKIRVLTNYGVLTTGFDAPKVRAIYITRPTFSLALYLQMIGRGLRGPVNGGTKDCLIVDVEDNFDNYNIDHVYKEMGEFWRPDPIETGGS
jgi:superfamily II DNA or RNA helicase